MADRTSFDRAADTYEATRGFPPGIADQVARAAAGWIGAPARVAEIGVGTGRIARPLSERGPRVIGVDLSRAMMTQLRRLAVPGAPRVDLVQGEAARLPLASGRLDAVVAVHVFHLISDWRQALAEVRRVLRVGGVFLSGYERRPADSPSSQLFERWRSLLRERGCDPQAPGALDYEHLRAWLTASGAEMDEARVGQWTVVRTPARVLETIEHRTWSAEATVPEGFFPACLGELRAWAQGRFGDLDTPFASEHEFVWQRFWWPSG